MISGQSRVCVCGFTITCVWFLQESRYFSQQYENDEARLVIAQVYAEDAGEYRVHANNESGSAKSACDLTVISEYHFLWFLFVQMPKVHTALLFDRHTRNLPGYVLFTCIPGRMAVFFSHVKPFSRTLQFRSNDEGLVGSSFLHFQGFLTFVGPTRQREVQPPRDTRSARGDAPGPRVRPRRSEGPASPEPRVRPSRAGRERDTHRSTRAEALETSTTARSRGPAVTPGTQRTRDRETMLSLAEGSDSQAGAHDARPVGLPESRRDHAALSKASGSSTSQSEAQYNQPAPTEVIDTQDENNSPAEGITVEDSVDSAVGPADETTQSRAQAVEPQAPDNVQEAESRDPRASEELEPPFIEDLSPDNIHILRGNRFQLCVKFLGDPAPTVQWFRQKDLLTPGKAQSTQDARGHNAMRRPSVGNIWKCSHWMQASKELPANLRVGVQCRLGLMQLSVSSQEELSSSLEFHHLPLLLPCEMVHNLQHTLWFVGSHLASESPMICVCVCVCE